MTGPESQHELDDELLSAYLDDELSPEERARVEVRLASDSSAAELLHQLRSVSQAVQALPQERGPNDVREGVIERVSHLSDNSPSRATSAAVQAERSFSPGASATTAEAPSFSIGRTRRGWIWASLAIAAALLIMVMQDQPRRDKVAAVDDRDSKSVGGRAASRHLEIRSVNEENEQLATSEPAAPAPAPSTEPPPAAPLDGVVAQSEESLRAPMQPMRESEASGVQGTAGGAPMGRSTDQLARNIRGGYSADRAPASGPATGVADTGLGAVANNEPATVPTAAMPPAESTASQSQPSDPPAYGDTAALFKEQSQAAGDKLVVVRVVARKDALEANAFEQLLARNGVEVVSAADDVLSEDALAAGARSRRFAARDQSGLERQERQQPERDETSEPAVEAVLVDAPEQTIISCLESIRKDDTNYLGVAVEGLQADEVQAAADRSEPSDPQRATAAPTELAWSRYNRGVVPRDKTVEMGDRYTHFDVRGGVASGRLGGRAETIQQLDQLKESELSLARSKASEAKNGTAVRLHAWGVEAWDRSDQVAPSQDFSAPAAGQPTPEMSDELGSRVSATAAIDNANLQVLFLLQPDESAAPSPATKARAQ